MRTNMSWMTLGFLGSLGLFSLLIVPLAAQPGDLLSDRSLPRTEGFSFSISADPAVLILEVATGKRYFRVFGDGRTEYTPTISRRIAHRESFLTFPEMEALVARAIASGLVDADHDALRRQAASECIAPPTDLSTTKFTIHLEAYSRGDVPSERLYNKIGVYAISHYAQYCEEKMPIYADLYELLDRVYSLREDLASRCVSAPPSATSFPPTSPA